MVTANEWKFVFQRGRHEMYLSTKSASPMSCQQAAALSANWRLFPVGRLNLPLQTDALQSPLALSSPQVKDLSLESKS